MSNTQRYLERARNVRREVFLRSFAPGETADARMRIFTRAHELCLRLTLRDLDESIAATRFHSLSNPSPT